MKISHISLPMKRARFSCRSFRKSTRQKPLLILKQNAALRRHGIGDRSLHTSASTKRKRRPNLPPFPLRIVFGIFGYMNIQKPKRILKMILHRYGAPSNRTRHTAQSMQHKALRNMNIFAICFPTGMRMGLKNI